MKPNNKSVLLLTGCPERDPLRTESRNSHSDYVTTLTFICFHLFGMIFLDSVLFCFTCLHAYICAQRTTHRNVNVDRATNKVQGVVAHPHLHSDEDEVIFNIITSFIKTNP